MKIVFARDFDESRRKVGQIFLEDFKVYHDEGKIGSSYQHLVDIIMASARFASVISKLGFSYDDFIDIARDAALIAWKKLANRHHSCPIQLRNEMSICTKQVFFKHIHRLVPKRITTFGTQEELERLGFHGEDDGGIDRTTLLLDLNYKMDKDLADFRSKLAFECLTNQMLTVREIREYAGFSDYQARELKTIMTNFMENYCGIS